MTTFSADYQRQVRAGMHLLVKRLEAIVETAGKIGHGSIAQRGRADKENLEARLVSTESFPIPEVASGLERPMIRSALSLYAHNLKAAAGTVTALNRSDLAEEFRAEADDIEKHVLPKLEEQTQLALAK